MCWPCCLQVLKKAKVFAVVRSLVFGESTPLYGYDGRLCPCSFPLRVLSSIELKRPHLLDCLHRKSKSQECLITFLD